MLKRMCRERRKSCLQEYESVDETLNSMNVSHQPKSKSNIVRIAHINAQSVMNKYYEIKYLLFTLELDILCITETCTKPELAFISYDGYDILKIDSGTKKRGIMIIYRKDFKVYKIDILHLNQPCNIEAMMIKCQVGYNKSFLVNCVYRHPVYQKATLKLDYEYFDKIFGYLNETKLRFFLVGDFNLRDNYANKLNNSIKNFGMCQLVSEPTRGDKILDLLICKKPDDAHASMVIDVHLSDHKLVYLEHLLKKPKKEMITIQYRNHSKLVPNDISKYFTIPEEYKSPDEHLNDIQLGINSVLNALAPIRKKSFKKREASVFVSEQTKTLMIKRDAACLVARRHPSSVNTNAYNVLRRAVKKQIVLDTADEVKRRIKEFGFWKGIRHNDDKKIHKDITLSPNELNDFFVSISSNQNADQTCDPPSRPTSLISVSENFCFQTLKVNELDVAWKTTKKKNSAAVDTMGWSPKLLSLYMRSFKFKMNILALFNSIIICKEVPAVMKCSKVVPIPKNSKAVSPNEFRPITIQTSPLKLLERCGSKQLTEFMVKSDILSKHQFGFRRNHSTTHALLCITEFIREAMCNNEFCVVIAVDFRKAFDTVPRHILLKKLKWYNIDPDLIESILSERAQFVTINGVSSDLKYTDSGVPQGSSISNLLFSLMVNDLPNIFKYCNTVIFADDTTLLARGKISDLNDIINNINSDLEMLSVWLNENQMQVNVDKTEFMVCIKSAVAPPLSIELKLGNVLLRQVVKLKILGVYIDNKLSWDDHVNNISRKVAYSLSTVWNLKMCLSQSDRNLLVSACILPIINYACPIWFAGNKTHQTRIDKIYRNVARYVLCAKKYDSITEKMCCTLKWLKCKFKYMTECAKIMYNVNCGNCPNVLQSLTMMETPVQRLTRNNRYVMPIKNIPIMSDENSFMYQSNKIWFSLPEEVKILRYKVFVHKTIEHLLEIQTNELPISDQNVCNLSCIDHVCNAYDA